MITWQCLYFNWFFKGSFFDGGPERPLGLAWQVRSPGIWVRSRRPARLHSPEGRDPHRVWVQPGAGVLHLLRAGVLHRVWPAVWDQVWTEMWDQIRGSVLHWVWPAMWDKIWAAVQDRIWHPVWDQIWYQGKRKLILLNGQDYKHYHYSRTIYIKFFKESNLSVRRGMRTSVRQHMSSNAKLNMNNNVRPSMRLNMRKSARPNMRWERNEFIKNL